MYRGSPLVDKPARKLNPLLKLAAISGVETAIKLHIRRGDDLDARDGAGATPLILAAAKRRKGAVRLLLDAGADPTLADESGMDALTHAVKGGCSETVALLVEALARLSVLEPSDEFSEETAERTFAPIFEELEPASREEQADPPAPAVEPPEAEIPPASGNTPSLEECGEEKESEPVEEAPALSKQSVLGAVSQVVVDVPEALTLDDEPLNDLFADDWEAEGEVAAPDGDETVAETARQVHEAIGRHTVVDRDEDWGDVDLHLPVRAAPLMRDEGGGAVRDLLLAALREGMVSEGDVIDVCSNADGSRNEEAERLLAFVAGELGATVVEWTGSEGSYSAEPTLAEERLLAEAVEFAEDIASGRNDPFRFYAKGIRGELLEAEEEIALGREMEEAGKAALSALAAWPEGLSALFDAGARVAQGEADAESFCAGPEPSTEDEPTVRTLGAGDDGDEDDEPVLDEEASFFVTAVAAVEAARDDPHRVAEVLSEARLTRGFLMELAERAGRDEAGVDFVVAIGRQAAARERMILCNLRLAISIAKRHLWSGIPFDDLVQEANIGLMKAVERYDWRRGFRFSTYATWWIRQQVSRSIADTGRVVRAPVHVQETARKVLRERLAVEARLGRPETRVETARRVGLSLAKTHVLLSMFDDVEPLDEIDTNTGMSRADGLVDAHAVDPADVAESASLRATLLGMLADLDERSREVILLRFGLASDDAMTLEEIGQHLGVTRERIRQIESKAMSKLSHRAKREILWPFMGDGYAPSRPPAIEQAKSRVSSGAADKVLSDEDGHTAQKTSIDLEAPSFPPPLQMREVKAVVQSTPVRGSAERLFVPPTPAPAPPGDQASKIADQARALGLEVDDRRAEGGELRIVAPFAAPPQVRAFGRRLLAFGFRKIQRDVFAK